jgi:hypothetical protein
VVIVRALSSGVLVALVGCANETFVAQGSSDAGDAGDAADAAQPSDAAPPDAGLPPGAIRCGKSVCTPPGEACCLPGTSDAGSLAAVFTNQDGTCVQADTCLPPSIALRCTTPSFCNRQKPGTVCCVSHGSDRFTTTDCVDAKLCDVAGPHDILCDPAANDCPAAYPRCTTAEFTVRYDVFGICVP